MGGQKSSKSGNDTVTPDAQIADSTLRPFLTQAQRIQAPAETLIFGVGSPCRDFLFLERGSVRVQVSAKTNTRAVLLYRVAKQESCVLTTSCLLAGEAYPAEGISETDIEAIAIPKPLFLAELNRSESFRNFVFASYATRLYQVIRRLKELTMDRVDSRLASTLLNYSQSEGTSTVRVTQAALAVEIGTSREVISRQLQHFQSNGWVQLSRGEVTITDPNSLREL